MSSGSGARRRDLEDAKYGSGGGGVLGVGGVLPEGGVRVVDDDDGAGPPEGDHEVCPALRVGLPEPLRVEVVPPRTVLEELQGRRKKAEEGKGKKRRRERRKKKKRKNR